MNRFGLSRKIPPGIQRQVRQRDGFGCVICGKAVFDYEHFDPEYADAAAHEVSGIVSLCIEHHGLKTRGLLSKQTIRNHTANPRCKQLGFSFGPFDIGNLHPQIVLGRLLCRDTRCLICIEDDEIFSVSPPIEIGLPFRINADLKDAVGNSILKIVNNEWQSDMSNWDVDVVGPVITIRNAPRKISLIIRSEPPERIIIERLDLGHKGNRITCREGSDLKIVTAAGTSLSAGEGQISGSAIALELRDDQIMMGLNRPRYPIDLGFTGDDIAAKISRNSICECGSGFRFKHCHGKFPQ